MKPDARFSSTGDEHSQLMSWKGKQRELYSDIDRAAIHVPLSATYHILMAQKGTVEKVLTILAGEKIDVRVLRQTERNKIINRISVLSGRSSGRNLLLARSRIDASLLPPNVIMLVRMRRLGIGNILARIKLETFAEITRVEIKAKSGYPYRKYTIFYEGRPAIKIMESYLF